MVLLFTPYLSLR